MSTFGVSSDWQLVVNTSRTATLDADGKITESIQAIEPDTVFTYNTIGIYVSSTTAKQNWYRAGNLYQAEFVPFGTAGLAQGDAFPIVLNRYQIHRFTQLPDIETQYLISFVPQYYITQITLMMWQYIGTNQGATLDSIATLNQQVLAQTVKLNSGQNGIKTSITKLTTAVNKLK